ncbi:MAG: hypothetical protein ACREOW_13375 [Thermodesulfobacteriota bacterium]
MCVTEFSPIYWFHEDEVYLPIDPKILVEKSELYFNGKKIEFNGSIDELEFLDESGINHWLAIPNINLGYPDSKKDETIKSPYGIGPKNVSNFIKDFYKKYEKNYDNIIYYRKGRITISNNDFDANVFSGKWSPLQTILPGEYKIIQYFPFYFFNDFTNLHIGDWDSTVEIIINETKRKTWIRTSAHHYAWYSEMAKANQYQSLNNWINKWQNLKDNELGSIFNINKHPFIFVSLGGHGCYPTPGYSLRGLSIKLPLSDIGMVQIPVATEERKIGKKYLINENIDFDKNKIKTYLQGAGISASKIEFCTYRLENVEDQPWYKKYMGRWGNRSKLDTWDSPIAAPNKENISKEIVLKKLKVEFQKGYKLELIFHNYHGLL